MDSAGLRHEPVARLWECVKNIWVPEKLITSWGDWTVVSSSRKAVHRVCLCLYKYSRRIFALILDTWLARYWELMLLLVWRGYVSQKWQIIDQLRATEREQELCNSSLFSSEHFCHRYRFLPFFPPVPSCQSEIHFFCYQVSPSPPAASSPLFFLSRLGTNVFTIAHRKVTQEHG